MKVSEVLTEASRNTLKLTLPDFTRPVFITQIPWSHKEKIENTRGPIKRRDMEQMIARWNADDYNLPLYGMFTDIKYHPNFRRQFLRVLSRQTDGIIHSTGDYEGLSISFESAKKSRQMAKNAYEASKVKEQEERRQQEEQRRKHATKISRHAEEKTPVYFFAKQDNDYHGLDGVFSGKVPLSMFAELERAVHLGDMKAEEAVIKKIVSKSKVNPGVAEYSFSEFFNENNHKVVEKLLKGKLVSSVGETGYFAASTKSLADAKEKVKQLFLKHSNWD